MNSHIQDMLSFLDESPTAFQASQQIIQRLQKSGFERLDEAAGWKLVPGGKYYVQRGDTAVLAFIAGQASPSLSGYQIAASHIDSPSLKLKPATLKKEAGSMRIGVEVYGGPIISTWLDRELGIAGRVSIREDGRIKSIPVNLKQPLAIIPNAAIHINREVNSGFQYNKQTHLQAILGTGSDDETPLASLIAAELGIDKSRLGGLELFLYDLAPAKVTGIDQSLIVSGRLDNLAMTHAILTAILEADAPQATCVAAFFDHEEIGSGTYQGADSSFLTQILERIGIAQELGREEQLRSMHQSFLISADMAHAFHPSYAEKYDRDYSPVMNGGPVIKINGSYRYTSTSESSLKFASLCEAAGVACQKFMVRSDVPCGSTVGPVVSALLGIPAVDIGNPMWAMHSVRETCGTQDHLSLINTLKQYYI